MPTRNVNLTDEQDAFVERMVKAGKYQNASEAMRDAVRGLQQRWKEDELKLKALRKLVRDGAGALERGEFEEVDDANLDAYLELIDKFTLHAIAAKANEGARSSIPLISVADFSSND